MSGPSPAAAAGNSSEEAHSDPFAAWVSSSTHFAEPVHTRSSSTAQPHEQAPNPPTNEATETRSHISRQLGNSLHEDQHQTGQTWPPPQHGVHLALREYYRLKSEYNTNTKAREQLSWRRFATFLGKMTGAQSQTGKRSSMIDLLARALVKIAVLLVPAIIYGVFMAYSSGHIQAAVLAALAALGVLFWAERRCSTAPAEKQQPASSTADVSRSASGASSVPGEITTVPWKPARGPRLRNEARSRRSSAEVLKDLKRRQRASTSRAGSEPVLDDAKAMEALWCGIEDVQAALYGEPSKGEFSARHMGLEEVALEVGRLAGTVGVSNSLGVESDTPDYAALLKKLAETKKMLGIR